MQSFKEFINENKSTRLKSLVYGKYNKQDKQGNLVKTFGIITPENPNGKSASRSVNEIARKKFESILNYHIYQYDKVQGVYGNKELSYIIINISLKSIMRLAASYHQQSFIYAEVKDETVKYNYYATNYRWKEVDIFETEEESRIREKEEYKMADSYKLIDSQERVLTQFDSDENFTQFKNFKFNIPFDSKIFEAVELANGYLQKILEVKKELDYITLNEYIDQSLDDTYTPRYKKLTRREIYNKGEINMESFKEFINENKSTRLKSLVYGKYNKKNKQGNLVKTFGIITPENPNATPPSKENKYQNAEYRKLFEKDLERLHLTFDRVKGKYGSYNGEPVDEISYIITNISSDQLKELASKYHQQSVIFANIEDNNIIYKYFETDYVWKELPVVEGEKLHTTTYRLKDTHKTIQTKFDDNNNFTKFKSFRFNVPFSIFEDINNCIDRRNEELNNITKTREGMTIEILHEFVNMAISNEYSYGNQHYARQQIFSKAKFDINRHPRSTRRD